MKQGTCIHLPNHMLQPVSICPQHPRFDFNLPRAMTPAEVSEVERLVNGWVAQATPTVTQVMDLKVRPHITLLLQQPVPCVC